MFKQHVNTPRYAKDAATKLYVDELGVKLQVAIDDAIDTIPPPLDAYTKTESEGRYVNVAGDTMTGDLTINKADAQIHLKKTAGTGAYITTYNGSLPRWSLQLGNVTAESGANAGSDFALLRFSDAGALVDAPLVISRSTGLGTVAGNPTAPLGIATKQYVDAVGTIANNKVSKTGDIMSGALIVSPKGSVFGIPSGSGATPTKAEANILLYDYGGDNWCGFGADGSGHLWARTGNSGSPGPAFLLSASDQRMTLAGNPTQLMHAATKSYVDTAVGAISTANFVLKTGDTMSGALHIAPASGNSQLWLDSPTGAVPVIIGQRGGVTQWVAYFGNGANGDFALQRYGAEVDYPLNISRTTGNVTIGKELTVSGSCNVWGPGLSLTGPSGLSASFNMAKAVAGDVIQSYLNSAGLAKWLIRWCDAGSNDFNMYRYNADASAIISTPINIVWSTGNINFGASVSVGNSFTVGGPITAYGGVWIHNNTDAGIVYLGNTGGVYLQNDGATLNLFGKPVSMNSNLSVAGQTTLTGLLYANGKISINNSTGLIANSAGAHALEVKSAGVGNSAFMAFHIPGSFASNFGIDTDTFWKVGGWSMGGVAHKVFHEGVCPNNSNYFKLTSGMMYVMGTCPVSMGNGWVTFPVAFPNICIGVVITGVAALGDGNSITSNSQAFEPSRFYFQPRYVNTGGAVGVATQEYRYIAWGY